ncbi:hypothetical protein DFH09DRAFT_325867 [Mycena vulgaris]|nr:hypothetical protein DFH09DRAFT_325867 [Mycena vulgaris]
MPLATVPKPPQRHPSFCSTCVVGPRERVYSLDAAPSAAGMVQAELSVPILCVILPPSRSPRRHHLPPPACRPARTLVCPCLLPAAGAQRGHRHFRRPRLATRSFPLSSPHTCRPAPRLSARKQCVTFPVAEIDVARSDSRYLWPSLSLSRCSRSHSRVALRPQPPDVRWRSVRAVRPAAEPRGPPMSGRWRPLLIPTHARYAARTCLSMYSVSIAIASSVSIAYSTSSPIRTCMAFASRVHY